MTIKLKPCPFCGDEAPVIKTREISDGQCHYKVKYIVCESCGARTMERTCDGYFGGHCSDEEIAAMWNQRVKEDDYSRLEEMTKKIEEDLGPGTSPNNIRKIFGMAPIEESSKVIANIKVNSVELVDKVVDKLCEVYNQNPSSSEELKTLLNKED